MKRERENLMKNSKRHLDVLLSVLARSNLSMYQLAIDLYASVGILNYALISKLYYASS